MAGISACASSYSNIDDYDTNKVDHESDPDDMNAEVSTNTEDPMEVHGQASSNPPSIIRFSQDDFRIRTDIWPLHEAFKTLVS